MDATELIEGYAMYVSPEEAAAVEIPDLEVEGRTGPPVTIAVTLTVHC
ncbi:hypothetical protein [Streptomyces sp. Tue6028]|nr:hypothetical protein [Streptomyces sp. Tue6028]